MSCDMDTIHERNLEEISEIIAVPTEWVTGLEEAYIEKYEECPESFDLQTFIKWMETDIDISEEIHRSVYLAYKV